MTSILKKLIARKLLLIKTIVDKDKDGDRFIIVWSDKNKNFIRDYCLTVDDIKDVLRNLTVQDYFAGPEEDRDKQYDGWIFKFSPMFGNLKLYVKIRIEDKNKAICLSIHEFGLYD